MDDNRSKYKKTSFKFSSNLNARAERIFNQEEDRRKKRSDRVSARRNIPDVLTPVTTPLPLKRNVPPAMSSHQNAAPPKSTKKSQANKAWMSDRLTKLARFKVLKAKKKELEKLLKKPHFWLGKASVQSKVKQLLPAVASNAGQPKPPASAVKAPVWHCGFSSISKKKPTYIVNHEGGPSRSLFSEISDTTREPNAHPTGGRRARTTAERFNATVGESFAPAGQTFRAPPGLQHLPPPRRSSTVRFSRTPAKPSEQSTARPRMPTVKTPAARPKKSCEGTPVSGWKISLNGTPTPQKSNKGTPGLQKCNKGTPAPLKSNKGTPAPKKFNKGVPASQKSNKRTPPPQKSFTGTPASQKSNAETPASQKSNTETPASQMSRKKTPSSQKYCIETRASQKSDSKSHKGTPEMRSKKDFKFVIVDESPDETPDDIANEQSHSILIHTSPEFNESSHHSEQNDNQSTGKKRKLTDKWKLTEKKHHSSSKKNGNYLSLEGHNNSVDTIGCSPNLRGRNTKHSNLQIPFEPKTTELTVVAHIPDASTCASPSPCSPDLGSHTNKSPDHDSSSSLHSANGSAAAARNPASSSFHSDASIGNVDASSKSIVSPAIDSYEDVNSNPSPVSSNLEVNESISRPALIDQIVAGSTSPALLSNNSSSSISPAPNRSISSNYDSEFNSIMSPTSTSNDNDNKSTLPVDNNSSPHPLNTPSVAISLFEMTPSSVSTRRKKRHCATPMTMSRRSTRLSFINAATPASTCDGVSTPAHQRLAANTPCSRRTRTSLAAHVAESPSCADDIITPLRKLRPSPKVKIWSSKARELADVEFIESPTGADNTSFTSNKNTLNKSRNYDWTVTDIDNNNSTVDDSTCDGSIIEDNDDATPVACTKVGTASSLLNMLNSNCETVLETGSISTPHDLSMLLRPTTPLSSTTVTPDVWGNITDGSMLDSLALDAHGTPLSQVAGGRSSVSGGPRRRGRPLRDAENIPPLAGADARNSRMSLGVFGSKSPLTSRAVVDPETDLISWDSPVAATPNRQLKRGRVSQLAAEFERPNGRTPLTASNNGRIPLTASNNGFTPRRSKRLSVVVHLNE